jgi:hypothetical protein
VPVLKPLASRKNQEEGEQMKLVEIEQDGRIAQVNPEMVAFVLPNPLVGICNLVTAAGVSVTIKGTVQEVAARLTGQTVIDV